MPINKYILIVFVLLFSSNLIAQKIDKEKEILIQTDIKFSDYSVENGINKAFIEYADESAVLLKPNRLPLCGIEAIEEYHANIDDSKFTLSWKPFNAKICKSMDLGYTFGIWKLTGDFPDQEGTYVSIWVKNSQGQWKYILDSGNEGLGDKKE